MIAVAPATFVIGVDDDVVVAPIFTASVDITAASFVDHVVVVAVAFVERDKDITNIEYSLTHAHTQEPSA